MEIYEAEIGCGDGKKRVKDGRGRTQKDSSYD